MEEVKGDTRSVPRSFCRADRRLLPIKAFYFTFLAGVGSLFPFVAIYMKQLGLTSSETGIIYGAMPFVCFFVRPLVGTIADRWGRHKVVLIVCTLLTAFLHLLIMLVPSRGPLPDVRVRDVKMTCGPEGSVMTSCGELDEEPKIKNPVCSVSLPKFTSRVTRVNPNYESVLSNRYNTNPIINITTQSKIGTEIVASTSYASQKEGDSYVQCRTVCTLVGGTDCDMNYCDVCLTNALVFERICNGTSVNSDKSLHFNVFWLKEHVTRFSKTYDTFTANSEYFNKATFDTSSESPQSCHDYAFKRLQFKDTNFTAMTCTTEQVFSCEMSCRNFADLGLCSPEPVSLDITFGLLFLLFFLASAAFSPIFSLADAAIFELLGDQQQRYGQQRMWGTLGLAIFAITCTFLMNNLRDVNHVINYDIMFYLFAGLCTLSAFLVSFMKISPAAMGQDILKNACRLLLVPEVVVFLLLVMYLGMMSGAVEGFLFWHLTDLGAGPLVFGFCLVVNCAFEIPFFFFSGAIIKRLGRMACFYSAMFVLSIRLAAYSLLHDPWHVLFVETLHGVTFAVIWAAVTTHANSIAPPGMSASTQGLVGGMNFGIGKGLGSLLTGLLFDRVGARWTFRLYAIACLLLLATYAAFNTCMQRSRRNKEQRDRDENKEPGEAGGTTMQQEPFLHLPPVDN